MLVWLNGRFVAARNARVSALDRGLLHGDGVYDTWRTYGGAPFLVGAHLRRLAAAARLLGLGPPGAAAIWERRTRLLVARSGIDDAHVRLTLTRGSAGEGLAPERAGRPTTLLLARRLPAALAARQEHGVAVVLLPFPRAAGQPPWAGLKLVGNASAVLGRLVASRRGAAEGLYVTPDGEVTEATSANLFLVEGRALVTPPRAAVLAGVTRALVIELARRAGIGVREERVTPGRLRRAREVFLTASTIEILPVVRVDARPVADGRPGPLTRRLQAAYAAHVERVVRASTGRG